MVLRLFVAVLICGFAASCGNSSSSSSLRVEKANLKGVWKLKDGSSSRSKTRSRPVPSYVDGTSGYGYGVSSMMLLISESQINIMTEGGHSSTCDLDRDWSLDGKAVAIKEKLGCNEIVATVTKLNDDTLNVSAEGYADGPVPMHYAKVSTDELMEMVNQLALDGNRTPEAVTNYLRHVSQETEESDEKDAFSLENAAGFQINRTLWSETYGDVERPRDETSEGSNGDGEESGEDELYVIILQGGEPTSYSFDEDSPFCYVGMTQNNNYLNPTELEIEGASSAIVEEKSSGIAFQMTAETTARTTVEMVYCAGAPKKGTFTISDFSEAVGHHISIIW